MFGGGEYFVLPVDRAHVYADVEGTCGRKRRDVIGAQRQIGVEVFEEAAFLGGASWGDS